MKTIFQIAIILLFCIQSAVAQNPLLLKTIEKIELSEDTIQSVYNWITDHISYDVGKANNPPDHKKMRSRFKSRDEYEDHLLQQVIRRKRGVCEDYARLFDAIVDHFGYESYIIEGYTKDRKGRLNSRGHAWNAVKVNGEWKLYDPTWGAGYVKNGKRFVKQFNALWYETDPDEMIQRHMPFDPVWQLSDMPITFGQFKRKDPTTARGQNKQDFDYQELISQHLVRNKKEQMQDQLDRSLTLGRGNGLVQKWRKILQKNIDLYGVTSERDNLETANEKSRESFDQFNQYFKAKNKSFKGKKWSVEMARTYLEQARTLATEVYDTYSGIEVQDKKAKSSVNKMIKQSERLLKRIEKEEMYLDQFIERN